MIDITQYVLVWLACCKEVWERWFKELDNSEDKFYEVEQVLFSSLVVSAVNVDNRLSLSDFYKKLSAAYKDDIDGYRSICKQQKAGNIFCENKVVRFSKGTVFSVKSIDFMGTMLDGKPYVELQVNDKEFVLEPVENLSFKLNN